MKINNNKKIKGFTLLEMVISIAIFAFLTAFLVAKYGSFNQGVLLTNLAYDVALTIRNAQSYGLNVKSLPTSDSNYSDQFNTAYGVHFSAVSPNNNNMIFFADLNNNQSYDSSPTDEKISVSTFKRGFVIDRICAVGTTGFCDNNLTMNSLDITYKRPDPDAVILAVWTSGGAPARTNSAIISLRSGNDSANLKMIKVSSVGQITVMK